MVLQGLSMSSGKPNETFSITEREKVMLMLDSQIDSSTRIYVVVKKGTASKKMSLYLFKDINIPKCYCSASFFEVADAAVFIKQEKQKGLDIRETTISELFLLLKDIVYQNDIDNIEFQLYTKDISNNFYPVYTVWKSKSH
jgi:hypothetical protein